MSGDLRGKRIAHFCIVDQIGEGGMGVVYKAVDDKLHRTVALKVLPTNVSADAERRHRFLREARAAAALTHANIAAVYEVGEAEGRVYIAMELVSGASLRARIDEGPLPLAEAVRIARRILRALAKAHENGIVHRDIKPDNVMVTGDGDVKLLDFGLAKVRDEPAAQTPKSVLESEDTAMAATIEGRVVGSPYYMSPEQATGKAVDARTDVFSFGVVLYEMLTGRRPFAGATVIEVIVAITRDVPVAASTLAPISPEVQHVIDTCLAKLPAERYSTARDALRDLERAAGVPGATASQPRVSMASIPGQDAAAPSPSPTPRRWSRTFAWLGAATTVVALGYGASRLHAGAATSTAPSAVASSSAGERPTAVTDLPSPPSAIPEALAAYRAALQAFRDGNNEAVLVGMRAAVRLDPQLAAAQLRLAFALFNSQRVMMTEVRDLLQSAARLRSTLDARDQSFLEALDSAVNREPPDISEYQRRLDAAVARYPRDAELRYAVGLAAMLEERFADANAAFDAALAIDDRFMAALRFKAQVQRLGGDRAAARVSVNACLERVPSATGCRNERIWLDEDDGRCDEVEADARQMAASDASSYRAYEAWATAAANLGRPPEAVEELLKAEWARAPASVKTSDEPVMSANVATLFGRLGDAADAIRSHADAIARDTNTSVHARVDVTRVGLALETADTKGAARIAAEFLGRQLAWSGYPDAHTAYFLSVERDAGVISAERFTALRAEFIEQRRRGAVMDRRTIGAREWVAFWASTTRSKADAEEALGRMPRVDPASIGDADDYLGGHVGRTLLLAGRIDDAVRTLRRVAAMCTALQYPIEHVHARALLGAALEAKGDRAGACNEYAAVLARWGNAKPRSVTADAVRARAKALDCAR